MHSFDDSIVISILLDIFVISIKWKNTVKLFRFTRLSDYLKEFFNRDLYCSFKFIFNDRNPKNILKIGIFNRSKVSYARTKLIIRTKRRDDKTSHKIYKNFPEPSNRSCVIPYLNSLRVYPLEDSVN